MGSVSEQVENPFRYASYRYDTETGLYYLQNRYYNPDLMRFISRDAIRDTVGEPSQSNYYQYADGNPIIKVDPDGRWAAWVAWSVARSVAYWAFNRYVLKNNHGSWYWTLLYAVSAGLWTGGLGRYIDVRRMGRILWGVFNAVKWRIGSWSWRGPPTTWYSAYREVSSMAWQIGWIIATTR